MRVCMSMYVCTTTTARNRAVDSLALCLVKCKLASKAYSCLSVCVCMHSISGLDSSLCRRCLFSSADGRVTGQTDLIEVSSE